MFERTKALLFRAKQATIFSSTDGSVWRGLSETVRNPRGWLAWFRISPRLKAVDKIANDIAAIDIVMKDKNGDVMDNAAPIQLLMTPNHLPEFTKFQLIRLTEIHIKLLGEAFWIVEKDARNNPVAILPIPPTWVDNIPRRDSETSYLVKTSDGVSYTVPKENMVYFKRLDALEPYKRGSGDTQQIGDELQIDEAMAKYQNLTFKNKATPAVAIGMKGANKEARDRFVDSWNSKMGGLNKSHSTAAYDGDSVSIQILSQTMKDLDYNDSRRLVQDAVLEHYMIPKELIGKVENSNRATITQAQIIYEKNALKPDVTLMRDVLNRQYVPMFKIEGTLHFINYITKDQEFQKEVAMAGWENGLFTRNQTLEMLGIDRVNDGDVRKQKLSDLFVQANIETTKAAQVEIQSIKNQEIILVNDLDDEPVFDTLSRAKIWKAIDDAAVASEKMFESGMKKLFQSQQNELNQMVTSELKSMTKAIPDGFLEQLELFFDEENQRFYAGMVPMWMVAGENGFKIAEDLFDFGLTWNIVRPEWAIQIERFGLERATGINLTTKEALKAVITEGINNGESIPQIRDRVSEVYTTAKTSRATMIARTETHMAVVSTTNETYKAAGVTKKEWGTTVDGREREWHGSMDGQIVDIDKPFTSGQGNKLMYPGDAESGVANEVIQCRCILLPVI